MKTDPGEFLGSRVVGGSVLSLPRTRVQSLVRELRSHKPQDVASQTNKQQKKLD